MPESVTDEQTEVDTYERLLNQERLILEATELIHELLQAAGATRADLAERLGTTRGYVTQVLNGSRNMTLRTLADLAFVLGQRVLMTAVPVQATQSLSSYAAMAEGSAQAGTVFGHVLAASPSHPVAINTLFESVGPTREGTWSPVYWTGRGTPTGASVVGANVGGSWLAPVNQPIASWPEWSTVARPIEGVLTGPPEHALSVKRQTAA